SPSKPSSVRSTAGRRRRSSWCPAGSSTWWRRSILPRCCGGGGPCEAWWRGNEDCELATDPPPARCARHLPRDAGRLKRTSMVAAASPDCPVVIEAGDLRKNAPLRAVCERAKNAAALPCYPDEQRDLARLIDDELGFAGLTIAPDARAALVPLLGGDRLASRSELRKLALYAHGKNRVELDDVLAVVADASALALDAAIDAAFAGRTGDLELHLAKAQTAGTSASAIISAA